MSNVMRRKGRVTALAAGGAGRMGIKAREAVAGYVFLLPWLLGLVSLTIVPIGASLWLSFTNYNLLSPPQWIGAQNYIHLFSSSLFHDSIRVTLVYVVLSVPLHLAFALLLAAALNRGLRGLNLYRAIYYVPSLLGASVAIAIVWKQIFGANGIVNAGLRDLGWHNPPSWVADPSFSIYTLVLLSVWQFGAPMIIFLAGLRQIPRDLYEAARVDGAGHVAQFLRITVPLLTPVVLFNLVMQMIGAFQAFTPAYIISNGTGGPIDSTLFYNLFLYQEAFGSLRMGEGAAMAWMLVAAVALVTGAIFLSSGRWVFYLEQRN